MTVLTLIRSELRRLTATRLGVIAFVALMLVPLLYGGLYLWGNRDPYANLTHVPAGLVVSDIGVTRDGTRTNYGSTVADSLVKSSRFDWQRMTSAQAAERIRDGRVDFVVTLPGSFSRDLTSAGTDRPTRAHVELATNDANSYLSSTIAGQAATAIRASVAQQVGSAAAKQFLVGLSTVRGNLTDAADSAGTLADGATKAAGGAMQLAAGATRLRGGAASAASGAAFAAAGADRLNAGADSAASGAATLATGASTTASGAAALRSGLRTLDDAAGDLPSATKSLATGADTAATGAERVGSASGDLAAGLARIDAGSAPTAAALRQRLAADGLTDAQIIDALSVLQPGAAAVHSAAGSAATLASGAASVASGSRSVASGTDRLAAGATRLARGVHEARTGAGTLATGSAKVAAGAADLRDGTRTLDSGASSLASGLDSLRTGTATLSAGAVSAASGAADLATGTRSVASGAARLHDGLTDGVTKIPATTASQRTAQSAAIGDPAAVSTTKVTSAGTYGAGLAPFFLSLALWIGSYSLFLIIRPLSRRALTAVHRPVRVALAGWLLPALLAAVQVAVLYLILTGPLGFVVANPVGMLGMMVLTAFAFSAILLLLNAALGSTGQFLGLVLMLVQLVVAGGTFPWQTLPGPLAALHQALPMSYAVDGLRQAMYGGDAALAWRDGGVLSVWLLVALALTTAIAARMTRRRTLRDLQPSLIGT
ncbi:YhgE/Pip family protein [uncultured Amnibacterium sp.]|uniref:YhgE/Pip family protein n=1 Tax=uncultured Amnibacterium sp. TaxID=1631851 RepID=UPI0035CAF1C1